ncbi:MAG TPA: FAD-dependent oxidoreductase [Thermoanaerobaculia bacterium]
MSPAPPLHVAVVGAGAFGGWTALWLRRRGCRVTLIDAWGPGNSRASSGGESRVIRGIYGPDQVYIQWVARSFEVWAESEKRWGRRLYHPTGALWMFSVEDSYARSSIPHLLEAGLPVSEISLGEARARFPQINFQGIRTVFFEERAGWLAARRACRVVAEAFVSEGGEYREATARPGEIRNGRMERLELSDGQALQADAYVFACGPWLGRLFPDAVGDAILPTRQDVLFFGTPIGDPRFSEGTIPIWIEFGERFFYGIPGNDHRGFKVADDTRGEPFDPTSGDRTPLPESIARARSYLALRFPALAGAPLVEARVCQYENSPDGHFLVDRHPEAGNVWLLGGGSGHGFKLGPALGEHAAGLVLGDGEPLPRFALARLAGASGPLKTQFVSGETS